MNKLMWTSLVVLCAVLAAACADDDGEGDGNGGGGGGGGSQFKGCDGAISFPDPQMEAEAREMARKPEGDITAEDLADEDFFEVTDSTLKDLTGIQCMPALQTVLIDNNQITDISPLSSLKALEHVRMMGLMTMGPFSGDPEDARPYFKKTKKIFDELKAMNLPGVDMTYLSMGMSNSYVVALEEGANLVRIGTKIFGERSYG